ncbi:hypothetical protein JMUB3933_0822 [Leptotrichia wadei]|uniref:Uncharacterized protein n=1 Tax=Leptotrichia wadei TaxID=157687 RepID=A0A510K6P4_9FUSO|nr:hypothetical protein [Leptotrichia wadei]BBM47322.1 hypothetical protein JMUB3933_0822 [Leptotrichia wadei]
MKIISSQAKKIIEEFIPTIKNIIIERKKKYKENNDEAIFQVLILLLTIVTVLINVTYSIFLKFDLNNIFSKNNFLLFIDLIKSNMFIFVLKYISDKNLFKEIINDSDEINLRIKNRIKTIFKVIIFYIIFYKGIELLTYQFFNGNNMSIVIIRFMIEKMVKIPTVIFIITYIIYILNDLIYLIVIKFIDRLK